MIKLIRTSLYLKLFGSNKLVFDEIFKNKSWDNYLNNIKFDIKNINDLNYWFEDGLTETDLKIFDILKKNKSNYKNIKIVNNNYKIYPKNCFNIIDKLVLAMKKVDMEKELINQAFTKLKKEYCLDC